MTRWIVICEDEEAKKKFSTAYKNFIDAQKVVESALSDNIKRIDDYTVKDYEKDVTYQIMPIIVEE